MTKRRSPHTDPLTPSESQADWETQGWAFEPVEVGMAPKLATTLSIRFDPNDARVLRQAARMKGMTKSEFVRWSTITAAKHCIETTPAVHLSIKQRSADQTPHAVTSSQRGPDFITKHSKGSFIDPKRKKVLTPS